MHLPEHCTRNVPFSPIFSNFHFLWGHFQKYIHIIFFYILKQTFCDASSSARYHSDSLLLLAAMVLVFKFSSPFSQNAFPSGIYPPPQKPIWWWSPMTFILPHLMIDYQSSFYLMYQQDLNQMPTTFSLRYFLHLACRPSCFPRFLLPTISLLIFLLRNHLPRRNLEVRITIDLVVYYLIPYFCQWKTYKILCLNQNLTLSRCVISQEVTSIYFVKLE